MAYIPPKPSGDTAEALFMQAVWERVFGKSSRFHSVPGQYDVNETEQGTYLDIKIRPGGGKPGKTVDATYKMMAIRSLGSNLVPALPDLLICSSVDLNFIPPKVQGDSIYVAKARTQRRPVKEFFFDNGANVTQNYTYFGPTAADSSFGDNFRNATDGINTELESVVPRYLTALMLSGKNMPQDQSFIYVLDLGFPTGVVDPTGADVTKIEALPARMWSKVVNA